MGAANTTAQNLPFHAGSGQTSSEGDKNSAAVQPSNVPFKASSHSRVLPSGTLLTVDLSGSLSTAKVHAGDSFTATMAAPLLVDGEMVIPTGIPVTGRVKSAQGGRSGAAPGSGYFELILNTMTVGGKSIGLQTSSLFARGNALHSGSGAESAQPRSAGIRVQKGRALTFRLTAPVTLDGLSSAPSPNPPGRTGE
jgi:hypothetical protein